MLVSIGIFSPEVVYRVFIIECLDTVPSKIGMTVGIGEPVLTRELSGVRPVVGSG